MLTVMQSDTFLQKQYNFPHCLASQGGSDLKQTGHLEVKGQRVSHFSSDLFSAPPVFSQAVSH